MSDELLQTHVDLLAPRSDLRSTRPLSWNADLKITSDLDISRASLHPAGRSGQSAANDANHGAQPPPKSLTG